MVIAGIEFQVVIDFPLGSQFHIMPDEISRFAGGISKTTRTESAT